MNDAVSVEARGPRAAPSFGTAPVFMTAISTISESEAESEPEASPDTAETGAEDGDGDEPTSS